MFRLLIAGALALALSVPAAAQDECSYTFDAVAGSVMMSGLPIHMLSEEDLPSVVDGAEELVGHEIEGVTRGFICLTPDGRMILGLEVDDCLLPRIILNEEPSVGNGA